MLEQQLQAEIQKNRNLLQSNFSLMEENEQCVAALTKLKNFFIQFQQLDDFNDHVSADDADALVEIVIQKVKQMKEDLENSRFDKTQQKIGISNQSDNDKWKDLYVKESQESYRLSKKVAQLEETITKMQTKNQLESKQIDKLLKDYLVLFKKVNSMDFNQNETSTQSRTKQVSEPREARQTHKSSKQKQKRLGSKSKGTPKPTGKKTSRTDQSMKNSKNVSEQNIPSMIMDELSDFPYFTHFLQNLRKDYEQLRNQNKKLRESITDAETLIRIYRQKQRERVLYGEFLVN